MPSSPVTNPCVKAQQNLKSEHDEVPVQNYKQARKKGEFLLVFIQEYYFHDSIWSVEDHVKALKTRVSSHLKSFFRGFSKIL